MGTTSCFAEERRTSFLSLCTNSTVCYFIFSCAEWCDAVSPFTACPHVLGTSPSAVAAVAAVGTTPAVAAAASVTTNYAFATFDLGGGAKAFAEYADGKQVEVGPSERDIANGTTVGVSFTF